MFAREGAPLIGGADAIALFFPLAWFGPDDSGKFGASLFLPDAGSDSVTDLSRVRSYEGNQLSTVKRVPLVSKAPRGLLDECVLRAACDRLVDMALAAMGRHSQAVLHREPEESGGSDLAPAAERTQVTVPARPSMISVSALFESSGAKWLRTRVRSSFCQGSSIASSEPSVPIVAAAPVNVPVFIVLPACSRVSSHAFLHRLSDSVQSVAKGTVLDGKVRVHDNYQLQAIFVFVCGFMGCKCWVCS